LCFDANTNYSARSINEMKPSDTDKAATTQQSSAEPKTTTTTTTGPYWTNTHRQSASKQAG